MPITMGPTSKAFLHVHCKGEQHKYWLQYGKVVAEYFPSAAPKGATPLLNITKHHTC